MRNLAPGFVVGLLNFVHNLYHKTLMQNTAQTGLYEK